MGDLLSIGDFASRCGLSAKMLRSYAAAGLLVPAAIDAWSGYRYYSTGQLHQARVIALLRRAGVGVDDIAHFFGNPDVAQLDRWDLEIVNSSASRRRALAAARSALALDRTAGGRQSGNTGTGAPVKYDLVPGTATHQGGRDINQDAALAGDRLFAVADGIGAMDKGEVASQLAVETLTTAFAADRTASGLLKACREANQVVWRQATNENSAMGTTLAALAITSDTDAVVLHVGDSRLYRLRNTRLAKLTQDHTVVAELIRDGELGEQDARTHPHRNVLTRAVGAGPQVDADYAGVSCEPGDRLMLCTDGLFNALAPDELKDLLSAAADPQAAADTLVTAAVQRGADDNVTAMVVDVQ